MFGTKTPNRWKQFSTISFLFHYKIYILLLNKTTHLNKLESKILGKKSAHLLHKQAKYKNVFIFNAGFCHEGEAGTFFIAHISVYYSVEYSTYAEAGPNLI